MGGLSSINRDNIDTSLLNQNKSEKYNFVQEKDKNDKNNKKPAKEPKKVIAMEEKY